MSPLSGQPLPPVVWEVVAASLLIAWRAAVYGVAFVLQDWFSILCVFWIVTAIGSRSRAWPVVAGATMAGLLVLYSWRHLPLTWAALGFGP